MIFGWNRCCLSEVLPSKYSSDKYSFSNIISIFTSYHIVPKEYHCAKVIFLLKVRKFCGHFHTYPLIADMFIEIKKWQRQ